MYDIELRIIFNDIQCTCMACMDAVGSNLVSG